MKKIYLTIMLILSVSSFITAQEATFGVTAGFLNITGTVDVEDNEIDSGEKSGGFLGIVANFPFSEKFHFQPEILYARNEDNGLLMLPLMVKYFPITNLNIQIGPQFDYSTDPYPIDGPLGQLRDNGIDIDEDDFTRFGVSLATGLGYDINEHFFLESRYTFQVNDVYTGDLNISVKGHIFNFGLGYRF